MHRRASPGGRLSPGDRTMSEDEENLAIALHLKRWQGNRAQVYIAEQLGTMALREDARGVARWQAIAVAFEEAVKVSRQ
jgi:hypothetical protein